MRSLLLLAAVALLAGCSLSENDDGAAIAADELKQIVLQPGDVSSAFSRFDEGRQGVTDLPEGVEPGGEGWKARYRRAGTPATEGPLVIASLVNRFPSSSDAEEQLQTLRSSLEDGDLPWRTAPAPELGDEAFAVSYDEGSVTFAVVGWRKANITASVEVNGFAGKLELADAVELARKQAQRIERAAS
jgi:hypothetical protein